jgi:hypothetical protein
VPSHLAFFKRHLSHARGVRRLDLSLPLLLSFDLASEMPITLMSTAK